MMKNLFLDELATSSQYYHPADLFPVAYSQHPRFLTCHRERPRVDEAPPVWTHRKHRTLRANQTKNGTPVLPQTPDDLRHNLSPGPPPMTPISGSRLRGRRDLVSIAHEEWRRSQAERLRHSLQKSCREVTVSLVAAGRATGGRAAAGPRARALPGGGPRGQPLRGVVVVPGRSGGRGR
ncbi:unnamed protein product [Arctogadus glacialis]